MYIVLYLVISILGVIYLKTHRNIFIRIIYLILILFSGLRYNVGMDFNSYINIYNKVKTNDLIILKKYVEFGYLYLNKVIITINGTSQLMFLVMAFLTNILIYSFIKEKYVNFKKKESYIIYTTYIYVFVGVYYIAGFNGIRQCLAIAIFLNIFKFIEKRKLYKYIFILLCGCFIHKSLLLLLPLYWILNIKKISLKLFPFLIIFLIFFIENLDLLISYIPAYGRYATRVRPFASSYILIAGLVVLDFIILFLHRKIKLNKYEYNFTFIGMFLLIIMLLNKNIYSPLNGVIIRFCSYFYFYNIITIPKILFYLKKIFKINIPLLFFIIISLLYLRTINKLNVYQYNLFLFF